MNKTVKLVSEIINAWDPYSLLAGGAPADEFKSQITQIASRTHEIHTVADTARLISDVFSRSFDANDFSMDACRDVAEALHAALSQAGLLKTRH
jgi:hypothetical protein